MIHNNHRVWGNTIHLLPSNNKELLWILKCFHNKWQWIMGKMSCNNQKTVVILRKRARTDQNSNSKAMETPLDVVHVWPCHGQLGLTSLSQFDMLKLNRTKGLGYSSGRWYSSFYTIFYCLIFLKFGTFCHNVIWCQDNGCLHITNRKISTQNQRWRLFSYFMRYWRLFCIWW